MILACAGRLLLQLSLLMVVRWEVGEGSPFRSPSQAQDKIERIKRKEKIKNWAIERGWMRVIFIYLFLHVGGRAVEGFVYTTKVPTRAPPRKYPRFYTASFFVPVENSADVSKAKLLENLSLWCLTTEYTYLFFLDTDVSSFCKQKHSAKDVRSTNEYSVSRGCYRKWQNGWVSAREAIVDRNTEQQTRREIEQKIVGKVA